MEGREVGGDRPGPGFTPIRSPRLSWTSRPPQIHRGPGCPKTIETGTWTTRAAGRGTDGPRTRVGPCLQSVRRVDTGSQDDPLPGEGSQYVPERGRPWGRLDRPTRPHRHSVTSRPPSPDRGSSGRPPSLYGPTHVLSTDRGGTDPVWVPGEWGRVGQDRGEAPTGPSLSSLRSVLVVKEGPSDRRPGEAGVDVGAHTHTRPPPDAGTLAVDGDGGPLSAAGDTRSTHK